MSKALDATLSIEIAERIKSKATDCFENAYQAALLIEGAVYVQGFLTLLEIHTYPLSTAGLSLKIGLSIQHCHTYTKMLKHSTTFQHIASPSINCKQL